jgi:hypothetical protein
MTNSAGDSQRAAHPSVLGHVSSRLGFYKLAALEGMAVAAAGAMPLVTINKTPLIS